jgi:hypothetical protein
MQAYERLESAGRAYTAADNVLARCVFGRAA